MVLPFQDSCGCFCIVVADVLLLSMVLYGVDCFRPVRDNSQRFWRDMCIDFSRSRSWSMVMACSRWLLPLQDSCSCFCMVMEGFYTF